MKLKRSERLIDMTQRLLDNPHTLISLTTFTDLYQSAKSSISEDIAIIKRTFEIQGIGIVNTLPASLNVSVSSSVANSNVKPSSEK